MNGAPNGANGVKKMKKRKLLKSGKTVSEVGLGCMSFAGFYGPTTEKEAHETLAKAMDLGIDFLDTANVYGNGRSEEVIGSFLQGDVSKFSIATKASIWRNPETGQRGFNNKPDHLRGELEKSLSSRLGLEHVDLFYIHRRDPEIEIEDVMDTLISMKAEGQDRRHRIFGDFASVIAQGYCSRSRWMQSRANTHCGHATPT